MLGKMDRQIVLSIIIAVASVLSFIISVLTGIPRIVRYYPGAVADFLGVIPLSLVSRWGERTGLFLFGLSLGWYAHVKYAYDSSITVDTIEGCVEVRDVLWKGTAEITNEQVTDISISDKPLCPDCQSPMSRYQTGSGFDQDSFWKCPSSDHENVIKRDFNRQGDAINLFSKHFGRIVESKNKEYSIDCLVENITNRDEKPTGKLIWEEYVCSVDDPDISMNCS